MLTSRFCFPLIAMLHMCISGGWRVVNFPLSKNPMDPRAFLLICLAAASRHQPSPALEVEAGLPTGPKHEFNETDFQLLRDGVNSMPPIKTIQLAQMEIWPSFLKAHPKEGWRLFKKLVREDAFGIFKKAAAESPAWPMLLETHNAEAWQLFQKLAKEDHRFADVANIRKAAVISPAWPMLLQTHNADAWQLFQKLAQDKDADVRNAAAVSPFWPMLLEKHTAEAWQLFQQLAQDVNEHVRSGAAMSPAWPMLLETHNAEAWLLFQKLAKDEQADVRKGASYSPAWPILLETHNEAKFAERWKCFKELATNTDHFLHRTCSALTAICTKIPKNPRRQRCHFAPRPLVWLKTPKLMLLGKNLAAHQHMQPQDLLSWWRTGSTRRSKPKRSFSTQPQFNHGHNVMNSLHAIILKGLRVWMIRPRKSVK